VVPNSQEVIACGDCSHFRAIDKADVLHILSPSHLARGAQMLDGRPTAAVNGPGAIFIGITVKKDKGWEI
jgi:hypothetical protein